MKSLRNYAISNVANHSFGVSSNRFNLVASPNSLAKHPNTNMATTSSLASNMNLSHSTMYANVAEND